MRLKELESYLQEVVSFENPKLFLEQYETPAHIAAHCLHSIEQSYGDLSGKVIADLGCGCGMLTIAAAICGASLVYGFDLDSDALKICCRNIDNFNLSTVQLIRDDVLTLIDKNYFHKKFDTVILNPPFGTKQNEGLDIKFLKVALSLSRNSVYSLHKSITREYITKKAISFGAKPSVLAELRYNLPKTYKFHKKSSVYIDVDFIKFESSQ